VSFHFIFLFIDIQVCCYNFSYFHKMLHIFSSPPFYTKYVHLPTADDPVPSHIHNNPKFWPFFKDTLGALDGSHIHSSPPASERAFSRNRKGFISQNCLFACSFSLLFVYSYTGWEGSATDARVYETACLTDLLIPAGKYFLADAGYPACQELLIPYRGVRYHLAEWGHANIRYELFPVLILLIHILVKRPSNKEELFNLRHASARNVIERIFGVIKRCFRILLIAPEYGLDIQAQIPTALCAIHNFIRIHDNEEGDLPGENHNYDASNEDPPIATVTGAGEEEGVDVRRDHIAQAMWDDYQLVCMERGIGVDNTDLSDDEESDNMYD